MSACGTKRTYSRTYAHGHGFASLSISQNVFRDV